MPAPAHQMMKPSEVADFERRLNGFIRAKPIWVARVPARLDVMGGIADYSGANVCQATLGAGVLAAVQARRDRLVRIRTERAARAPSAKAGKSKPSFTRSPPC